MLQSSLCLNKRQEEILQLKTSIINQKKLYCDGNDFYIIHPEIRLIEKLPKGNELVRFFKDNMLKKLGYENLSVASIKSLLNELAVDSEIHIENAVFEKNMEYVNFRNGVLDINTGKFTAEADGYFDYVLDCKYITGESRNSFPKPLLMLLKEPMDLENIGSLSEQDKSKVILVLEAIGYILADSQQERKAIFFIGPTASGKSTLAKFIASIITPKSMVKKYTLTQMAEGFSSMSAVQAKLNYADELDVSSKKSLQLFKLMVSGGELTLPQKYAEDRDVPIRAKLLFCCNELPDLHNLQTEAIMDRVLLIGFKNSVKKRDSKLADYLYEQRDRIVSMAFDAYMETKNKRKFTDSKFAQDLFKIYSVEQKSNKNFVNDCLKLATDGKIASSRLFDEYLSYCQAKGMRIGEIFGLEYSAIDFEKNLISVKQTVVTSRHGKRVQRTAKNSTSLRTILVERKLVEELRKAYHLHNLKKKAVHGWVEKNHDFIIENADGSFCDPAYFGDKIFKKKLLRKAGLSSKFRFHDCRHDRKCLGYCAVAENCPYGRMLKEKIQVKAT